MLGQAPLDRLQIGLVSMLLNRDAEPHTDPIEFSLG